MNDLSTAFEAEQLSDEVIADISQLLERTTSTSEKGELFKKMPEKNHIDESILISHFLKFFQDGGRPENDGQDSDTEDPYYSDEGLNSEELGKSTDNLDQKRFIAPRKLEIEEMKKMEEPIVNFPPVRRQVSSRVVQEGWEFSRRIVCPPELIRTEFGGKHFSPGASGKTVCETCVFAKLPAEQVNLSSAETNRGNKPIAPRS